MKQNNLTEGKIFPSLLGFAVPVFFTMLLQFLYGTVDMFVVSRFASTAEASGVTTGSIIMATLTNAVTGLTTGVSVLVAQRIGERDYEGSGRVVGGGIALFAFVAAALTVAVPLLAESFAHMMDAPSEAYEATASYIRITGLGSVFIIAYNVLGGIFRGLGDSRTPLLTVAVAAVVNLIFDIVLVRGFGMGAAGAAVATVAAQGISVAISLVAIRRTGLPFAVSKQIFAGKKASVGAIVRLGLPVAVQNLLSSFSFVIIQALINGLSLAASVGAGIGDKVGGILLLLPASYLQAMSAFVAQNIGAKKRERAKLGLMWGIITALGFGIITAYISVFHGDFLGSLFTNEPEVIKNAHWYIASAYGVDCMLTAVLFCLVGYFNGNRKTVFSLVQGLFGAFVIRLPYAFFASSLANTNIFFIGLAAPVSSFFQIILCVIEYIRFEKNANRE